MHSHDLRNAKVPVPDGIIPTTLPLALSALGLPTSETALTLLRLMRAQLIGTYNAAIQHKLLVAHFWRCVGIPLADVGHPSSHETTPCQHCHTPCRNLYRVMKTMSQEHELLIKRLNLKLAANLAHSLQPQGKGQSIILDAQLEVMDNATTSSLIER